MEAIDFLIVHNVLSTMSGPDMSFTMASKKFKLEENVLINIFITIQ